VPVILLPVVIENGGAFFIDFNDRNRSRAARFEISTARLRFGAFASMADVDTEISGRRQKAK
jgi:hypothetical protein